jgi:hypothetical protein
VKKYFIPIIVVIIAISCYFVMLMDTNPLKNKVINVMAGRVDQSQTIGKPINIYNTSTIPESLIGTNRNITLIRLFTIHNFSDGVMWVYYTIPGNSYRVISKWILHKENGEWEITKIIEAP